MNRKLILGLIISLIIGLIITLVIILVGNGDKTPNDSVTGEEEEAESPFNNSPNVFGNMIYNDDENYISPSVNNHSFESIWTSTPIIDDLINKNYIIDFIVPSPNQATGGISISIRDDLVINEQPTFIGTNRLVTQFRNTTAIQTDQTPRSNVSQNLGIYNWQGGMLIPPNGFFSEIQGTKFYGIRFVIESNVLYVYTKQNSNDDWIRWPDDETLELNIESNYWVGLFTHGTFSPSTKIYPRILKFDKNQSLDHLIE